MVDVKCHTKEGVTLGELVPFQGDLKRRSSKDIASLGESIKAEGLLMPFAVWKNGGAKNLLDGHGRLAALTEMSMEDADIAKQAFPVIYIEAETEEQAKKSLLQITSSYGRVDKAGAAKFCASIPQYKAPIVNKFVKRNWQERKLPEMKNEEVIRIAVPHDKAAAVRELFKSVDYIRML